MRNELYLGYQACVSWNVILICSKIQLCCSSVGLLIIFTVSVVIKDSKLIELMYNPTESCYCPIFMTADRLEIPICDHQGQIQGSISLQTMCPFIWTNKRTKNDRTQFKWYSFKWYSFICHVTIFFRWATLTLSRQVQAYTLACTAEPSSLTMAGRESCLLLQMWGWFHNGYDWRWKTVDC